MSCETYQFEFLLSLEFAVCRLYVSIWLSADFLPYAQPVTERCVMLLMQSLTEIDRFEKGEQVRLAHFFLVQETERKKERKGRAKRSTNEGSQVVEEKVERK